MEGCEVQREMKCRTVEAKKVYMIKGLVKKEYYQSLRLKQK